jgi:hypothetical protein
VTANQTDGLRAELQDVLSGAEAWLRRLAATPDVSAELTADLERDADTLRKDRTRAASTLINVALLGAFSSGKSFLVSGLQGHLELVMVPRPEGRPAEMFVGLLPSSPVPTNVCPATVVPVDDELQFDTSGTGFMRVRFEDSDEWENVGNSSAPSVVASYVTQDANLADRHKQHRARKVAEVQLLISRYKLRAKLYDLPGSGSPYRVHDKILKSAMSDADCFIYVCHASAALSDSDLTLIRSIYEHYLLTKRTKRIIWVVTAIDSARQLDYNKVESWKLTVAKNDAYLREHFTLGGQPDIEFINEGFVPVSPAEESRGSWDAANGDAEAARQHSDEGRMESLRDILEDLIEREAGKKHIAQVASGAAPLISRRTRALNQSLQRERIPIEKLKASIADDRERLQDLEATIPLIRAELQGSLRNYVNRTSRPFDKLPSRLHEALDQQILSSDITKLPKANRIQVIKVQTIHAWIEAPGGPSSIWKDSFTKFKDEIFAMMQSRFDNRLYASQLPDNTFDVNELTVPRPLPRISSTQDTVQRTAAVIGVVAPIAAAGTWVAGAVTAGVAFPPAGAIVGLAALVYAAIERSKKKGSSLDILRQEWISSIDKEAAEIRKQFELAIGLQGMLVIDNVMDYLSSYRAQVADSMARSQDRMSHPESQGQQEFVNRLDALCRDGNVLERSLWVLANC